MVTGFGRGAVPYARLGPMEKTSLPDVLFLDEVSRLLRVPVTTLRAWARSGRLPAVRIGRRYMVCRCELEALLTPAFPGSDC